MAATLASATLAATVAMACGAVPRPPRSLLDTGSYGALAFTPGSAGPWPLLLYLHGAGEMGGSLEDILSEGATGTPPVSLRDGTAIPELSERFVVVAPHTRRGWDPAAISKLLDYLLSPAAGLDLDERRLYVTGHSMGGGGALAAATTFRFAAVVPVAASGSPRPAQLRGVPVWAFHGENDVIVSAKVSKRLIEGLRAAGALEEDTKLTLYEDAPAPVGWPDYYGHASTIPAYATPELYDWLLAHAHIRDEQVASAGDRLPHGF